MTDTVPMQVKQHRREPGGVGRPVAERAYEVYTALHPGQSFDRLHERGGFGTGEMVAFLYAYGFPRTEWSARVREALGGMRT